MDQFNKIEIKTNDLRTSINDSRANEVYSVIENRLGELNTSSFWSEVSAFGGKFYSDVLDVQFESNIRKLSDQSSMLLSSQISLILEGVSYENFKASNFEIDMSLKSAKNPLLLEVNGQATDLFLETANFLLESLL